MAADLKLRAFWNYDLYPYLCSDNVRQMGEHGSVEVGNSPGYWVHPRFLLPAAEGKKLAEILDGLEANKRRADHEIHVKYVNELNAALARHGQEPRIDVTQLS